MWVYRAFWFGSSGYAWDAMHNMFAARLPSVLIIFRIIFLESFNIYVQLVRHNI